MTLQTLGTHGRDWICSDWLARYAQLDSDVFFRMNFHKNAIHSYTGISNTLHCAIKEKEKMLQESNVSRTVRLQLKAAKDELTKRNEEQAAEIQSLKRKLQASKASYTLGLQGRVVVGITSLGYEQSWTRFEH